MKRFVAALLLMSELVVAPSVAEANITVTALEVGPDVVFSFSGSLNTSPFTFVALTYGSLAGFISPDTLSNAHGYFDRYSSSITNPSSAFATSGSLTSTTTYSVASGNGFRIDGNIGYISLPQNYVSNTLISSTMTYLNQTISSLGLIPGTYVWALSGSQTVTLIVGSAPAPSAVPTLSEWAQFMLGLMVMILVGWHFHRERSY